MPVKQVVVEGYDKFWKAVGEMEAEATSKKIPLIVIIKSSNQPDGKCWCRDCMLLDKMLTDKIESKVNGIIVKGKVGTLEDWMDDTNQFKTDTVLRIGALPTAYRWKDGHPQKRMESPDVLNPDKFKTLFAD